MASIHFYVVTNFEVDDAFSHGSPHDWGTSTPGVHRNCNGKDLKQATLATNGIDPFMLEK